ncbi:Glycerol uptake protein 1 [Neolecta irregularis DAH-3]|uniref:Glycerol uptake protein 1 n=1 Tax=Neolecta irregularis (strain DAH-3) TaxID=1198029 RepID=A0A1U7LRV3_NEOID|nr:Glycerol uptake protein 1 [Neolecta irregularis DAH-3]|eukprot:OLL25395.1 Glycerol uptake protein 1 [Neolecta irregularis DAH-3]
MIDKIEAPENMLRCMSNSYSASGFWRSWHRSFNRWILRYIYIPLGGSKRSIPNTFIVFTFVALWHDLSFKLLTWGWLIALFIIPELVATALFPAKIWAEIPWYRHLCAVGAVLNLVIMMVANLIGFCLGVDGMKSMLKEILSSWRGIGFFVSALGALFVGVQVMFEYREEEKRKGIYLKC